MVRVLRSVSQFFILLKYRSVGKKQKYIDQLIFYKKSIFWKFQNPSLYPSSVISMAYQKVLRVDRTTNERKNKRRKSNMPSTFFLKIWGIMTRESNEYIHKTEVPSFLD